MKRVVTALVLVPAFVYIIGFAPQWGFLAAAAVVATLCFREFVNLAALHNLPEPGAFGYAAGLALMLWPRHETGFVVLVAVLAMALSLRTIELVEALPFAGT